KCVYVRRVPRSTRVQHPGPYHVVTRGNNKQEIFDDYLRRGFLVQLDWVARLFDWRIYAWALMTNHFHLVLEIGEQGLAAGMHRLNLAFAVTSNERFERINHCLGNRYWSRPIDSEPYLDTCIRYALWNPARAGIVKDPLDSGWTSLRASVGLETAPRALALND